MCQTDSDTAATDVTVGCCGVTGQASDGERGSGHWLGAVTLDQQLPDDLRMALERFFDVESVDTLADWRKQIHRRTGGGVINVDHLCHTDEETDHWGAVGGERYHFQCFYDAVVLAALEESTVDIHTVSPGGVSIDAYAVGSEALSVTPETTVFSLGIALDAGEHSTDTPTMQDAYAAICPYVKAFPDHNAYEAWADEVPAVTVAMPLSGAMTFARALAAEGKDD